AARGATPGVSEADIRKEYDRLVALMAGKQEYRVRHILVSTEAQAQAALRRIEAGEAFESVAREASLAPRSRVRGGDLGWSLPEHFVKEFCQTVISLAPHGVSSVPTKTRFGWHVVEVTESRPVYIPPYEQVRDRIAESIRQRNPAMA